MTNAEDILAHHGVKGMKWGQHKERGAIRRGLTKANVALDAGGGVVREGEKKLVFLPKKNRQEAATRTQNEVLGKAIAINRDPKYNGKDLKKDPELKAQYHEEVRKAAVDIYKKQLGIARTEATVELIEAAFAPKGDTMTLREKRSTAAHADKSSTLVLELTRDDLDHIVGVKARTDELSHSDDILEHHGVKGMKWGVRKDKTTSAGPQDVTVKQKPGKFVKTEGGGKHPASQDALDAAMARQKARASTTDALSNKELQVLVTRMNLEQQLTNLEFQNDRRSKGAKFVSGLLGKKRYTGDKRKFKDDFEELGGAVADAIKKEKKPE